MLFAILKFLPAFLPVAIYIAWFLWSSKKQDIKIYDDILEKRKKYRFYAIISTGALIILIQLYYAFTIKPNTDNFNPSHSDENGVIVPAQ